MKGSQDKEELESLDKEFEVESLKLKKVLVDKLYQLVGGKSSQGINNVLGEEVISKSKKFTTESASKCDFLSVDPNKWTTNKDNNEIIIKIIHILENIMRFMENTEEKRFTITIGDELPSGVFTS